MNIGVVPICIINYIFSPIIGNGNSRTIILTYIMNIGVVPICLYYKLYRRKYTLPTCGLTHLHVAYLWFQN